MVDVDLNIDYSKIDIKILDTIKLLNSKGYVTEACCSGHEDLKHSQTYILFNRMYAFDKDKLPKEFYIDSSNAYRIYVRTIVSSLLEFEVSKERIDEYMSILHGWAKALPDINTEEDSCLDRFHEYKKKIYRR